MFHHFTFYGFLLCFASTSVAAFYDNFFGWRAPYAYLSVPVVLGALGGIGLIVGPLGLLALKIRRDQRIVDPQQDGMDLSFIGLLLATGDHWSGVDDAARDPGHESAAGHPSGRGVSPVCDVSPSASSYTGSTGRLPCSGTLLSSATAISARIAANDSQSAGMARLPVMPMSAVEIAGVKPPKIAVARLNASE